MRQRNAQKSRTLFFAFAEKTFCPGSDIPIPTPGWQNPPKTGPPGSSASPQISENFAISDPAPRVGRLSRGFRAPWGRTWGVATGARPGPIWGANSVGVSRFWGRELAPRIPQAPPRRFFGEFQNVRTSPSFREFLGLGPCAPKRAAVSGDSGRRGVGCVGSRLALQRARFGGLAA